MQGAKRYTRQSFRVHNRPCPFVNNFVAELEQLPANLIKPSVPTNPQDQLQRWLPPAVGVAKLNVDGAISRNRHGGPVSALCRDYNGNYLGSSVVVYLGVTDSMILETYACREALALAEDLAIHDILVASDCQGVVSDIMKGT